MHERTLGRRIVVLTGDDRVTRHGLLTVRAGFTSARPKRALVSCALDFQGNEPSCYANKNSTAPFVILIWATLTPLAADSYFFEMASPPIPTKTSKWGSFISQAVAGVESTLDTILADADEAPVKRATTGRQGASRSSSRGPIAASKEGRTEDSMSFLKSLLRPALTPVRPGQNLVYKQSEA